MINEMDSSDIDRRLGSDGQDGSTDNVESTASNASSNPASAYSKLQSVTRSSIKRMTSKNKTIQYIKTEFSPFYRSNGKFVLEVYKSMMNQMEKMTKEEFQMQLEANDVEYHLDQLGKTIQDLPVTDNKWRPSGNPEEDTVAHLQKVKAAEVQQLEKMLSSLECQNKLLNEHVARVDQKLKRTTEKLENQCQKFERAASMLTTEDRVAIVNNGMHKSHIS